MIANYFILAVSILYFSAAIWEAAAKANYPLAVVYLCYAASGLPFAFGGVK